MYLKITYPEEILNLFTVSNEIETLLKEIKHIGDY